MKKLLKKGIAKRVLTLVLTAVVMFTTVSMSGLTAEAGFLEDLNDWVDEKKEETEDIIDDVKEGTEDIIDDVKEEIEDIIDDVKEETEDIIDDVNDLADEKKEETEDFLEDVFSAWSIDKVLSNLPAGERAEAGELGTVSVGNTNLSVDELTTIAPVPSVITTFNIDNYEVNLSAVQCSLISVEDDTILELDRVNKTIKALKPGTTKVAVTFTAMNLNFPTAKPFVYAIEEVTVNVVCNHPQEARVYEVVQPASINETGYIKDYCSDCGEVFLNKEIYYTVYYVLKPNIAMPGLGNDNLTPETLLGMNITSQPQNNYIKAGTGTFEYVFAPYVSYVEDYMNAGYSASPALYNKVEGVLSVKPDVTNITYKSNGCTYALSDVNWYVVKDESDGWHVDGYGTWKAILIDYVVKYAIGCDDTTVEVDGQVFNVESGNVVLADVNSASFDAAKASLGVDLADYDFDGWYTDASYTTKLDSFDAANYAGGITVYGKFVKKAEPTPVEPTEPTPVEPTEPTPVEPTEPTPVAPVEPTPVEPTEPTPVEPTEPTPVEPTEPTPVEPTEPTPVEPAEPTPVEPTEPTPVEPTEPVAPVEPTEEPTVEPTEELAVEPTVEPTVESTDEVTGNDDTVTIDDEDVALASSISGEDTVTIEDEDVALAANLRESGNGLEYWSILLLIIAFAIYSVVRSIARAKKIKALEAEKDVAYNN